MYKIGHANEENVRVLVYHEGVHVDSRDDLSRTPLSWASQCGDERKVRLS